MHSNVGLACVLRSARAVSFALICGLGATVGAAFGPGGAAWAYSCTGPGGTATCTAGLPPGVTVTSVPSSGFEAVDVFPANDFMQGQGRPEAAAALEALFPGLDITDAGAKVIVPTGVTEGPVIEISNLGADNKSGTFTLAGGLLSAVWGIHYDNHFLGLLFDIAVNSITIAGLAFGISNVFAFNITGTEVPLPPAVILFGTALAGMGFLARRRKKGLVPAT
jgi:hypothetical protein